MKFFFIIFFLFLFNNCSFDNKTGIWNNEKNSSSSGKNKNIFEGFEKTSVTDDSFSETFSFKGDLKKVLNNPINNKKWNDIFYDFNNNSKNFRYSNRNEILFKSQKLTKNSISKNKLYINGNLIINDNKGNVIVFSINQKKIISKFNFYKKQFKKLEKELNLFVENDKIFIADNLGFVYAYNYITEKIIWAKNYKIPFSSNLKVSENKIFISNQNNNLYILDKNNGNLLKLIPTEETNVKNQFKNNLSIDDKKSLFFLNSFGSLYSIDLETLKVNWFNNFNQSLDLLPSNLFFGNKVVNSDKKIIVSSNSKTFLVNSNTGNIIKKFNFSTKIKPIIIDKIVFILTKNNYLIALDLNSNNFLYSHDLSKIKGSKIKWSEKEIFTELMVLNSEIFIFTKNSNVLNLNIDGTIKEIKKIPSKIKSYPLSIDNALLYLNSKNKLIILS